MPDTARYALYFVPPESSAWGRFGADWFARVPEAPRRYGFHATLKAPFRLASDACVSDLLSGLRQYCGAQQAFTLPPLKVTLLDDFLALVPVHADRRVDSIGAECVMRFDRYRASLTAEDLARRRPERLDRSEMDMLQHWGYPYVLDLFRFHLSLTGPLGEACAARAATLGAEAAREIASLGPARFDSICVLEEPCPGAGFRLLERVSFDAQVEPARVRERAE